MRNWTGINVQSVPKESQAHFQKISQMLFELSAAIKKLQDGQMPDSSGKKVTT